MFKKKCILKIKKLDNTVKEIPITGTSENFKELERLLIDSFNRSKELILKDCVGVWHAIRPFTIDEYEFVEVTEDD